MLIKNTNNTEALHAPNLGENTKEILFDLGYLGTSFFVWKIYSTVKID